MKKYFVLTVISCAFLLGNFVSTPHASAATVELHGWAWSSTIGWVSLNSADDPSANAPYAVTMDDAGNLHGYAWSSTGLDSNGKPTGIGWIQFDAGCPTGPTKINKGKGNLCFAHNDGTNWTGWIKALAGGADGWDGWISLNSMNDQGNQNPAVSYGVTKDSVTGKFSGFSWGSTNVGWLHFDKISTGPVNNPPITPVTSASCASDVSAVVVGDTVTWSVTPTGSGWTYSWSGTDNLTGTGPQVIRQYSIPTTPSTLKTATVTVTAPDGSVATKTCTTSTGLPGITVTSGTFDFSLQDAAVAIPPNTSQNVPIVIQKISGVSKLVTLNIVAYDTAKLEQVYVVAPPNCTPNDFCPITVHIKVKQGATTGGLPSIITVQGKDTAGLIRQGQISVTVSRNQFFEF